MRACFTAIPDRANALEDALDLLADGVALLRRDGGIVYANEALRILAARGNDFRIDRRTVEFPTIELRTRFAAALSAVQRVEDPAAAFGLTDFAVPREGRLPPFTVSVRPLTRAGDGEIGAWGAVEGSGGKASRLEHGGAAGRSQRRIKQPPNASACAREADYR